MVRASHQASSGTRYQPVGVFARAARRYLDELASQSLTQQIDEALQAADDDSNAAAAAGRSYLAGQDDW